MMTCRTEKEAPQQSKSTKNKPKRASVIPVACETCRKRKSKCDGKRPACSTCTSKGISNCVYEPEIDGSRNKFLRRQNCALQDEVKLLRQRLDELRSAQPESSPKSDLAQSSDGPDLRPLSFEDEICTSPRSDTTNPQLSQMEYKDRGAFDGHPHSSNSSSVTGFSPASLSEAHTHGPCYRYQRFVLCEEHDNPTDGLTPLPADWAAGLDSRNQIPDISLPNYMVPPVHKPHDDPMSNIYTSFRDYARQAIANGDSIDKVLGPPDLDAAVDLSKGNSMSASELSQWASQVVSSYGGKMSLTTRLGAIHLHMTFMRWQVQPSAESFREIPELMKPLPSQLTIPHFAIFDFVQWPAVRDVLIRDPGRSPTFHWVNAVVDTLDLANLFKPHEILYKDPQSSEFRLRDSFKQYLGNPCHWVTGPQVGEMQPAFKGRVHFR